MRSNGPEGVAGRTPAINCRGIKQVKSPSCRMGFLRFCRPASVPVCLPGGAAPTGATGLSRSVARTGTPHHYR
ncbi:hypothetical protein IE986_17280 [Klebsiella pneumoniae]|uniref:Uncharacterized protein n=1 Tax=Klebsiella pneumoniae TaxID=573 RepID=A0A927HII2_KLEPN|nr:hypothetical protein [Klebsiella pneumoniae]